MTEIEYFARLGSMLGYYTFREDTCNGANRPMDLTWWDSDSDEYYEDFILHLERENLFIKDEETLDKLFCQREYIPSNVIGIINVTDVDRIEYLMAVTKRTCQVNNAFAYIQNIFLRKTTKVL